LSLAATTSSPAVELAGYPVTAVRYVLRWRTLTRMFASGGANGGRSRLVTQQGDLAEAAAASERLDDASVEDHPGPTGRRCRTLAAVALLEHRLSRNEIGARRRDDPDAEVALSIAPTVRRIDVYQVDAGPVQTGLENRPSRRLVAQWPVPTRRR
jgi:hypothetical protein